MIKSAHSKRVIWIIDDDETVLLLAEEILGAAGFDVKCFSDASRALAVAESSLPDLVVVDVLMPGLNGFDFCARLRQLPQGDTIPVLVTTSLDDTDSINRAFEAGATNFATKPINWSVEVQRLNYLLKSADLAGELRAKEQETRRAKEDWESTFDSIADAVAVLDMDHKVLRANRALFEQFSGSVEAVTGRVCHQLFHQSNEPCGDCPVSKMLATKAPASVEIRCETTGKVFEITVSPITDAAGRVVRMVHVARNLIEKKKLEAELRHAQKMEAVGTLAGGIAHDFNNLLTAIQCCSELSIADNAEAGRHDENLDAILETARRGATLTKQLLLFSRKKSRESQMQLLNLNEVLTGMKKMLEKGLSPTVAQKYQLAPDLYSIHADSGQLEQIIMNLAVNASHAMALGGTIAIETRNVALEAEWCVAHPDLKPDDYVLLSVSDTGHGMDKQTLARIYEPFFTTKKVGEGTGLGLSVVFGIVEEHEGHIECHSEVGRGTTFNIYFPANRQGQKKSETKVASTAVVPGGTETILVVDDEAPIRRLLERHLSKLGYTVVTAADGESGMRKYHDAIPRPHMVILDLGMPNSSGWQCLEKLGAFDPHVKVLVASGYGAADLEDKVLEKGAAAFLRKPFSLATMAEKLRGVLDAPFKAAHPAHFQI